jgi:hypothetical protein
MPSIRDRDEENARRKNRLAQLKKGPGTFVYDGSCSVGEAIPTPLLIGRETPEFDSSGIPVVDSAGRQVMRPGGQHDKNEDGTTKYGGVPKVVMHPIEVYKIRGYEFPAGKSVFVGETGLARKLRGMDGFEEVEGEEVKIPGAVKEMTYQEMRKQAKIRGIVASPQISKVELATLLEAQMAR